MKIDDYAYRLGRDWKLGSEKGDDGVILLVAPNERKVSHRDRLWRWRSS